MNFKNIRLFKINELQTLILGFLVIIFIGAILLWLPISSQNYTYTNFLDSLFAATSVTCVTGLVTLDTGSHWSYFGKLVILCLIQVGALGFMSFSTLLALILGKKITLKERLVIQQSLNSFNVQGLVKMSKYILLFTFLMEGIGAAILSIQFIPQFGFNKGLFYSIFYSVSAFCNAGIDLIGNGKSLMPYYDNSIVILTISILIIIGSLGFVVWQEIYNIIRFKNVRKISLHAKVCITMTMILIIFGTILFFLFEFDNPNTIGNMTIGNKLLSSFFASVVPRSAGFNSISVFDMTEISRFLTIILMFIGGAPGSTAGGIKITTTALIIMTVVSVIKGRSDTEIYNRTIKKESVYKAIVIVVIDVMVVLISSMILAVTESGANLETVIFECVSAFGTVGLTLGLTENLSVVGKVIITIAMFFGRLGSLTMILSMINKKMPKSIKYPEDKILIG